MSLANHTIGEAARSLDVSAHTLRYYEKIGLLSTITKDSSGKRRYSEQDILKLKFIKRAQRMNFSLDEIKQLIRIDQSSSLPKPKVRGLVKSKLEQIDENLKELKLLKRDLSNLLSACESSNSDEKCPILEGIKHED